MSTPLNDGSVEAFDALTICYYHLFRYVTLEIQCIRPLGFSQGWSKQRTAQAAYRALLEFARIHASSENQQNYIKKGFIFLGYQNDAELNACIEDAKAASHNHLLNEEFFLERHRRGEASLNKLREQILRTSYHQNSSDHEETYSVAALYTQKSPQSFRRLTDASSSALVLQSQAPGDKLPLYRSLFTQLDALLGNSENRRVAEFSVYNAEELWVSRSADEIHILVLFNTRSRNPKQYSLLGLETPQVGDQAKPAFVIQLDATGKMVYSLENIEKLAVQVQKHQENRVDHVESICQLFLEHFQVGTFHASQYSGNIFAQISEILNNTPFLNQPSISYTNFTIGSQDSEFQLERSLIDDATCERYGLKSATEFKFTKKTISVGGGRGSGYQEASRTNVLKYGITENDEQWIDVELLKSDYRRVLSDQSITQIINARLRV